MILSLPADFKQFTVLLEDVLLRTSHLLPEMKLFPITALHPSRSNADNSCKYKFPNKLWLLDEH